MKLHSNPLKIFKNPNLIFSLLLLGSFSVQAEVPAWSIIPEQSTLSFKAVQNNAPITGQFKQFEGEIHFDPNQLAASQVSISIDINSLSTSYPDLQTTLMTPLWFDATKFPKATFKTSSFKRNPDHTFEATGDLTLKDKTISIPLVFQLDEYTKDNAQVSGHTVIKRTDFGVGQGEWAKTDSVQNEVQINFSLTAKRK